MCVRALLTLVLTAALMWQSEALTSTLYSRKDRAAPLTPVCYSPSVGRGVWPIPCTLPIKEKQSCRFECVEGYTRTSGDTIRTCRGGSWSGEPLVCEYTGCDEPPKTQRSVRKGCWWPYASGETCTYTCYDGHIPVSGDFSITCNNGTWSGTPLICENTGCDEPPYIHDTKRTGCRSPYEIGESCTYMCKDGFSRVSGDSNLTCVDGTWSGTPLNCELTGCDMPPVTLGSWQGGCKVPCRNGEKLTYTCMEGLSRVSGNYSITCVDGSWSGNPLECRRTTGCDHPPNSNNQGTSEPRDCHWPYEEGETCWFSCQVGWKQESGDNTNTCTDGKWTGAPLLCTIGVSDELYDYEYEYGEFRTTETP